MFQSQSAWFGKVQNDHATVHLCWASALMGLRVEMDIEHLCLPVGWAVLGPAAGLLQSMAEVACEPLAGLPATLSDVLLPDTCTQMLDS